ncbi:HPP family protein [Rhodococcus sp. 1168]|uniref:HPP family protein n=1 Tax=Rhodococcus sp. 1168 TaxID=2018041 RepID=UPI000A09726B|nr:HPP family protein [Rhodococcus sp. 1168]ORI23591.1 hypothetical protein BJI47_04020 [Rhodococcus sp. 1168]
MSTDIAGKNSAFAARVQARARSAAPPRPDARSIAVATATSALALLALAGLTELTAEPFLIPPLAASVALVAGAPKLPLAQPRNVIGGQGLSALVGVLVGYVFGNALWAAALAGALALCAMLVARMAHSPAAATAAIGTTGTAVAGWQFVVLAAVSAVVLVIVGVVGHRLNRTAYPAYLW